jgi:UDP-N-acetylmuramoyl-L-alanyl-D-glutamate--2,6-diaminopimelate ligase
MLLGDLATADLTLPEGAGTVDIAGLSADSRAIERGYLFAALPGTATDGARFAGDAVGRGAAAILAGRSATLDVKRGIPIVRADDPRHALALMAARFHPCQPEKLVAVTGTSGKTSVAAFARQIFEAAGRDAASVGTIGVVSRAWNEYGNLTTPDPVALHVALDRLARAGVTHAAIEASSHGLDQRRLDGIRIVAAAFTNLGRDHMDYHATVADYLGAKLRLFTAILPKDGIAVVDMDGGYSEEVAMTAAERGEKLIRTGRKGREIRLVEIVPDGFRQRLRLEAFGKSREVLLPLAGAFQASNALVAAGLAIGAGIEAETALAALDRLSGAPGRIELVGRKANGAMIFVDYAHKPDALAQVLDALRPHTENRLLVVFGCGGDRDPGKRPVMGEIAAARADLVYVTDDNPRSENPAAIRRAILEACPGAVEIGDRRAAIRAAIGELRAGDVLVVAGKGHESGQIVGDRVLPFDDAVEVRGALTELKGVVA